MKAIDPRSLIGEKTKEIEITQVIKETFCQWKKLIEEKKESEITIEDAFLAGYILSNPNVRCKFKRMKEKEIKFDCRIN